jgi:outer membrane protein assembly factor BamB
MVTSQPDPHDERGTGEDQPLALPLAPDAGWLDPGAPLGYLPLVTPGLAFLSLRHGEVRAVDAATGAPRWSRRLAGPYPPPRQPYEGALHLAGDLLLVRTRGELLGLDAATGEVRARTAVPLLDLRQGGLAGGVLVSKVEGPEGCALIGWDVAAGRERWSRPVEWSLWAPLSVQGDLVVASDGPRLLGVGAADGELRWTASLAELTGGGPAEPRVVAGKGAVVVGLGSWLLALEPESGAMAWKAELPVRGAGSLAVTADGTAWLLERDLLCSVQPGTGRLEERTLDRGAMPPCAGRYGPLAATRTHLVASDVTGPSFAVSRATGGVDWALAERRERGAAAPPMVAAGRLFLLDLDGRLQVLAPPGAGPGKEPWPSR